jgi:asparagine synthase (glutamine-hydrolysing)
MCGICGITWNDQNLIRLMGNACKHRGPEQEGFYIDDFVSIGCERLKIQDISEVAKQPIYNEDKTICVVLNGEIYNFKELRKELEKNHQFYTESDTEVIVHAYEEFGEDCLDKLDGMFAFAIWDTIRKKLFIARDRIGVKPLFYCVISGRLLFASELKSLLQFEEIKREINYNALCQFVTYAYTIDGQTLIKSINELLPGHKLVYEFDTKSIKIEKYWELKICETNFNEDYYLEKLRKILEKSVEQRMISDVPLGAFLSGGLDSSVIVAIMSKFSSKPVKTFTTGFGHDLDEYDEAKIVSEHCNTEHREIIQTYSELTKSLPKILWHMEFPYGRPSILSNYLACRDVKKYVTVAFTGEGADECFGGYNRYLQYVEKNGCNINQKIQKITSGFFKDEGLINNIFSEKVQSHYHSPNNPTHAFGKIALNKDKHGLLNKALFFELKTEIPGAQTWRIDRMGSAHALELREPYLDYRLVEFSTTIPSHFKINNLDGVKKKYILQKLALELLPPEITKRKKFPWGIPFYDFFKSEFLPVAEAMIHKSIRLHRPYLKGNSTYIDKIFKKITESKNQSSKYVEIDDVILRQILFLFNLELWYQIFIESDNLKNPDLSLNRFV